MKALGVGLFIIGYALFYTGASNLFTGGQGWGFLQSLLNKGEANQSGFIAPQGGPSSKGSSGGSVGGSVGGLVGELVGEGLDKLLGGLSTITGGVL